MNTSLMVYLLTFECLFCGFSEKGTENDRGDPNDPRVRLKRDCVGIMAAFRLKNPSQHLIIIANTHIYWYVGHFSLTNYFDYFGSLIKEKPLILFTSCHLFQGSKMG